ncbi:allophanate hydrolase [Brachybacterium sp. SGAir0954]|uniref:5-oxoprolinase subunit B/C family protein n=1 Tax=Brachybacterium sp. SGAir0954 TaxID=2571029 RepID=UPI0010CD6769|nr:carboxyltransferase domain-containing protein [Brachybacterium sp. SGAir0954]QCR52825.1 allophanate hydrolase [Brachybacterium sp. SGAir0954]
MSPGEHLPPPQDLRPAGEAAVLAVYPDTADVLGAASAVRALAPAALADLVPAERTLLLRGTSGADARTLAALLEHLPPAPAEDAAAQEVEIPVVYDGEDLAETAALLGLEVPALVTAHTGTLWTAAFGGFAPGFSYLVPQAEGEGPRWQVPRRSSPRTAVPPGSVALAAGYCGVYPRSSPGGWQLVGRADVTLFDPERTPPALLAPGTRVRFRARRDRLLAGSAAAPAGARPRGLAGTPVGAAATSGAASALELARREAAAARERLAALRAAPRRPEAGDPGSRGVSGREAARERSAGRTGVLPVAAGRSLEVLAPGPLLLVEDAGRPGRASIGVSSSGAFDRGALVSANLAVGNPPHAAALEGLLGPLRLRASAPLVIALAGAPAPVTILRGDPDEEDREVPAGVSGGRAFALDAGDELTIGPAASGLRIVLAVRGGITGVVGAGGIGQDDGAQGRDADGGGVQGPVLGSLSRDTLSGLGPAPLGAGDQLGISPEHGLDAVPAQGPGPVAGPDADSAVGPASGTEHDDDSDSDDPAADPAPAPRPPLEVPVVLGPRDVLLGEAAVRALRTTTWRVRSDSDRVGVRLDGPPLPVPEGAATLPSEAMLPGAVQVPPSGLPVVFGPDHPTTGGYPVIGVVTRAGLDQLAQAAPGTRLRLVAVDPLRVRSR